MTLPSRLAADKTRVSIATRLLDRPVVEFGSVPGYGPIFNAGVIEIEGADSLEDPRVQWVRSRGHEQVVMTYTHLPHLESGQPWRVGMHRLRYQGGRFALNPTSGRVVGPDGVPDKDAVLFNLRDGRIALIHRIHPDMQLAVFESLEHLADAGAEYWDDHLRNLDRHILIRPA